MAANPSSHTDIMPPNRIAQEKFDPSLLEPGALVTPGGLQTALSSIERVSRHDDSSVMEMVVELSSRPHIFEYIISSTCCMLAIPVGLILFFKHR